MNIAINPPRENRADTSLMLDHLFRPMGVDGVYARTAVYEDVVEGLQRAISAQRPDGAGAFRFPPVMSRRQLEDAGYLKSFPQLLGCVCALHGTERDILAAAARSTTGEDWTRETSSTDLVMIPAACYPVYPIAAARGPTPSEGYIFDVAADCFRHEPSRDLDRLQSFRMREFVRIGSPEQVVAFRASWIDRASFMATQLRLPFKIEIASDPFFGRVGQFLAASQMENALKFELLVPVRSAEAPTACMGFNYHKDHFSEIFGLKDPQGESVHTGCVAFGIDRLALALFSNHGLEPGAWPQDVRAALSLAGP
jgi:seryl-tRNA synthetase